MSNLLNLIDRTEGGGKYDTLFGHSQREGNPFAGVDVTQMTLDDLAKFSDPSGDYGQWVKNQVGHVATPMGRYQIVGTTLRNAADQLGLSGDTVFNEQTQDRIANHLAQQRIAGVSDPVQRREALRNEWAGLRHVDDAELDAAIQSLEQGEGLLSGGSGQPGVQGGQADPIGTATDYGRENRGTTFVPQPVNTPQVETTLLDDPQGGVRGPQPMQGGPDGRMQPAPGQQGALNIPATAGGALQEFDAMNPSQSGQMIDTNGNVSQRPKPQSIPMDQIGEPAPLPSQRPALEQSNGDDLTEGDGTESMPETEMSEDEIRSAVESTKPEDGPRSIWEKLVGGDSFFAQNRSEALLAIGSGLLSGNNWQEGLSAASENLLGIKQRQKGLEERTDSNAGFNSYRSRTFQMKDGSVASLNFDRNTGRYLTPDGRDVSDQIAFEVNNSDAFGTKGQLSANQALKQQARLTEQYNTLDTMDRVYENLDTVNYGVEGFVNELEIMYDTLLQKGLSEEEIRKKSTQGELQGLIGATREQVVGGGVMTEQDALRVIQALGGDMKGIFSNPEVAREQLANVRRRLLNTYETEYEQYDAIREKYPNMPYVEVPRYEPKEGLYGPDGGALDRSNTQDQNNVPDSVREAEDILDEMGI